MNKKELKLRVKTLKEQLDDAEKELENFLIKEYKNKIKFQINDVVEVQNEVENVEGVILGFEVVWDDEVKPIVRKLTKARALHKTAHIYIYRGSKIKKIGKYEG